ncbi:PREDICTED: F-box protein At3g13820-like [Camelina sativa]|uniref:F-box protein At3g13820-like n=1 Tax=Camelina sativa TaxID=90675 RepID=A0ABM0WAM7_CAMSA|nr:PREDICTED: F-box protein At3g13820-like [Camelina sativa]
MTMMSMSNLPKDLNEEIISRIPVTSLRAVRSTCNKWNDFSKRHIIGNAAAAGKQFVCLMLINEKVCSLSFNLQIHNDGSVVSEIKQVHIPDHVRIDNIFHCDGLFLCVIENNSSLMVWNPYLGQTMRIEVPFKRFFSYTKPRRYRFYYDDRRYEMYALGYDNNRNHKILRILRDYNYMGCLRYEIYRFNSNLWSSLDVEPNWIVQSNKRHSVSLKGNTYFLIQGYVYRDTEEANHNFLICFDFAKESFGPRLLLPSNPYVDENIILSCVGEEKLALLHRSFKWSYNSIEIWVTNKIDPNAVSWSKFLKIDINRRSPEDFRALCFFIEEEKKVAVLFDLFSEDQKAHIIGDGDDAYLKYVNIRRASDIGYSHPLTFSSYVPSLVQLQINQPTRQQEK